MHAATLRVRAPHLKRPAFGKRTLNNGCIALEALVGKARNSVALLLTPLAKARKDFVAYLGIIRNVNEQIAGARSWLIPALGKPSDAGLVAHIDAGCEVVARLIESACEGSASGDLRFAGIEQF